MSKINNQSNSLDSINFVRDIEPEIAANYSGGLGRLNGTNPDLILYDKKGLEGRSVGANAATRDGIPNIGFLDGEGGGPKLDFNDKTSSIRIRRGVWAFYSQDKYDGRLLLAEGPGTYDLRGGDNNRITSFRRIAP